MSGTCFYLIDEQTYTPMISPEDSTFLPINWCTRTLGYIHRQWTRLHLASVAPRCSSPVAALCWENSSCYQTRTVVDDLVKWMDHCWCLRQQWASRRLWFDPHPTLRSLVPMRQWWCSVSVAPRHWSSCSSGADTSRKCTRQLCRGQELPLETRLMQTIENSLFAVRLFNLRLLQKLSRKWKITILSACHWSKCVTGSDASWQVRRAINHVFRSLLVELGGKPKPMSASRCLCSGGASYMCQMPPIKLTFSYYLPVCLLLYSTLPQ